MALIEHMSRRLLSYAHPDALTMRDVHLRGGVQVWSELLAQQGASAMSARALRVDIDQVHLQSEVLARRNAAFITDEDLSWPKALTDLPVEQRPIGLWLRGAADLRVAATKSVAIVGSRACTNYGERMALSLAGDLASRGWAVTSGGAFGIDAAAHRGTLAVGGLTLAVLANGIDVPYPRAHDSLFEDIAQTGLLISEVPPGEPPARYRFLERNRLIAALSKGTIVVEASHRSGALSTASKAHMLARPVMAIPGLTTSLASVGTHRLIQEGAALVTCADDVADLIDRLDPTRTWRQPVLDPHDDLDDTARRVMDALPARSPSSLERVCAQTGLRPDVVLSCLGTLAMRGLVEQSRGQWRLTDVGRSGTTRAGSGTISM